MNVALVLALLLQVADTSGEPRRVDGRIVRGSRAGPIPLVNHWVVLHRLTPSRSGPIDSMQTGPKGQYSFRYRATTDSSAIYFATTSFGGIVYPTAPFRVQNVSGDDATITVFDTTSGRVPIKLAGRHLIIGAPQPNGRRPVGEVLDLENDSTVTVIARDSVTPVYVVHVPEDAANFRLNADGEFGAGAISRRGATVGLYAPLSPGIRQFAFTYELPAKAFPWSIPSGTPIDVLEVLVEEPTAEVRAPAIREVRPESMEGRTFRRFLARDLPPTSVLRVDVPKVSAVSSQTVIIAVVVAVVAAMGVAIVYAARRSRPQTQATIVAAPAEPRSQTLVRAIADLDEEYEASSNGDARAAYEARRASLKSQLADALAAERGPS